jgi:hypothetical protein
MKKTIFLFFGIVLLGGMMTLLQVQGAEADCSGGINIYACPNSSGCIIPSAGGPVIHFTTDKTGFHFEGKLCAGSYYVCVQNCGTGSFTSDGHSEGVIHITNGADCHCP